MSEQEEKTVGRNYIFDMVDGSQILVTTWGNDIGRIAFRADAWSTWSPPVQATKIEQIGE